MSSQTGLIAFGLAVSVMLGRAQGNVNPASRPDLVHVPGIEYPAIARAARVSGDVHLTLVVRKNGTVDSATVADGPPMLRAGSIAAAKTLAFDCRRCVAEMNQYELTFQFRVVPTDPPKSCKDWHLPAIPTAVDSTGHFITVSVGEIWTCDPAVELTIIRFRAAQCLYLWKCGAHKTERTLD